MSDSSNPDINYADFRYYAGLAADTLNSLATSANSIDWMTSAQRAALRTATDRLIDITLNPAIYWLAYQDSGWVGVVDELITDGIEGPIVSGIISTATRAALGVSPAGAAFTIGLVAGVVASAAIGGGLDWMSGGSILGLLSGVVDGLNDNIQENDETIETPDGTVFLGTIYLNYPPEVESYLEFVSAIEQANVALDMINYAHPGSQVQFDFETLSETPPGEWDSLFQQISNSVISGNHDVGLLGTAILVQSLEELKDIYDEHPEYYEELFPDIGAALEAAIDAGAETMSELNDIFSPLILDMDGDGIETLSFMENGVEFDFEDGDPSMHGWIAPDDAFLAIDLDGNGNIDSVSELFGSRNTDGFSILAEHDTNHDGVINNDDSIFTELLVWTDANTNGISDEGEMVTLQEAGIVEISLTPTIINSEDSGNWVPLSSEFSTSDGASHGIADVYFSRLMLVNEGGVVQADDSYVLLGTNGDDTLLAGSRDQIIRGGAGNDTFVFQEDHGSSMIVDFDIADNWSDTIELHVNTEGSRNLQDYLIDDGEDTLVRTSESEAIRLAGISCSDITDENLILI